jgi:hypothetical protein
MVPEDEVAKQWHRQLRNVMSDRMPAVGELVVTHNTGIQCSGNAALAFDRPHRVQRAAQDECRTPDAGQIGKQVKVRLHSR